MIDQTNKQNFSTSQNQNQTNDLNDVQKSLLEKNKEKKNSLSDPSIDKIQKLSEIRELGFFQNLFRPLERGSLRYVVLLWLRMTIGCGILTLPLLISKFGLIIGLSVIFITGLLNLISFKLIIYCSIEANVSDYPTLVQTVLSKNVSKIFRITFFIDMCSFVNVYAIFGWNLFEFLLNSLGLIPQDWIKDAYTNSLYEYNPQVFKLRVIYFLILFLVNINFLLKKNLDKLKPISFLFLIFLSLLLLDLFIEAPFFRNYFQNHPDKENPYKLPLYKPFSWELVPLGYSILQAYYVQPFTLSLRNELLLPTNRRLNKVANFSIIIQSILYIIFSGLIFFSFGEGRLPDLIILRVPFPGKSKISEYTFIFAIFFFF